MDSHNNLAKAFLSHKWMPYIFPPLLFGICFTLQTHVTLMTSMLIPGGYFIVSLTQGARIASIFLFGLRGVIAMTVGAAIYFYLFPQEYDPESFTLMMFQNVIYTLVVYLSVEIVRRIRKLNRSFDGILKSDMLLIIAISAVTCALIQTEIVPYAGQIEYLPLLSFQIAGRIVGSLIILYLCMFILNIMQRIQKDAGSTSL